MDSVISFMVSRNQFYPHLSWMVLSEPKGTKMACPSFIKRRSESEKRGTWNQSSVNTCLNHLKMLREIARNPGSGKTMRCSKVEVFGKKTSYKMVDVVISASLFLSLYAYCFETHQQ